MSHAYYNENDPYAAQWVRNLIAAGHIAPGDVDEQSIEDVRAADLVGYTQCHFFAGIGVWSYALRLAGWPDDREVWTGSCPCQPFSDAGARAGFEDRRNLWPVWSRLIRERRPVVVFGEQVASRDGLAFLDVVHDDLEAEDYTVGAVDTCAAGVGAPHIRQRLFFVADSAHAERGPGERGAEAGTRAHGERRRGPAGGCADGGGLADARGSGRNQQHGRCAVEEGARQRGHQPDDSGVAGCVGIPASPRLEGVRPDGAARQERERPAAERAGPVNGFWRDADWLPCIDGKARPVEPGTFPLAHGAPNRVGRLRAYGNCINAETARHFIEAYMT